MLDLDDKSPAERAPFQPTEAWIEAFEQQFTTKLQLDMKAYARWRGRGVRRCGGLVTDTYAEDLVATIVMDTLAGVVAWNPDRKTLYQHVQDTIKSRTRHERDRAKKFRAYPIDAAHEDHEKRATRALVEASLQQDAEDVSPESAVFASQMIARLRELAAGDKPVLAYLDAIVAGASTAAAIMEHTKMSKRTFRNARDRLSRLVEQLDRELIEEGARA